ncbi:TetR family transcriptional regulator [Croceicoccus sp. F390]|uniref:TetR family transcriptional regulator n=1 Tax=Croceicoccus esteveae TaxID=3075597 RepID=A0ABU2ZGI5_9SPHN|nr:TetR family transcriptional regulator [Croceicoccus sp. F390]MDT0575193.1 TetR family transcriptional regulator [Croceicoccus sp. F390]
MLSPDSPSSGDANEARTSVGRPRLLTREAILDAAVELGLEALTMKRLSARLGTGAATLYQYFENRDALMRAAALHAFKGMRLPRDEGQHWSAFARDHAHVMQGILVENPTAVTHYLQADYGFEVQFELIEHFLAAMQKRGFLAQDGMKLLRAITMASMYCAIEINRERAFATRGDDPASVLDRQLLAAGEDDLPFAHAVRDQLLMPAESLLDEFLNPIFRDIAWQREESPKDIEQVANMTP